VQPLAWAAKVDDAARARVSKNSDMRNFIVVLKGFFLSSDLDT
jgi:hypothetical protein